MPQETLAGDLKWLLGGTMLVYTAGMYALGMWAKGRIRNAEDFIVAGRRLPLSLAWCTLLATWFGAGTMLAAADEARSGGLAAVALDPFGAGFCLILAGLFFARPLWEMGLLTICDFFRRRFGPRAEVLSALILVPSYFGWIAAQFVALAGMLNLFLGLDMAWGIALAALVGTGYTLLGGMWSVTLTDALQVVLMLVGLVVLLIAALVSFGDGDAVAGAGRLIQDTPREFLAPIPTEKLSEFVKWLSLFCAGALGNIPAQDLTQRIFAARSARVAQRACWLAGAAYLAFGMIPIILGLLARLYFPGQMTVAILPALASAFLHPAVAVVFIVVLMSAVLSTIDSAILSPASVITQNLLGRIREGWRDSLLSLRLSVAVVAAVSLGVAYLGENAYRLLEQAYSLMLVGLFVPLVMGLFARPRGSRSALAAMGVGSGLWLLHLVLGWECFFEPREAEAILKLPVSLTATLCALIAYLAAGRPAPQKRSESQSAAE